MQIQHTTLPMWSRLISMMLGMVVVNKQLREHPNTPVTFNLFVLSVQRMQEHQLPLHSKVMKIQREANLYCPHPPQYWSQALTVTVMQFLFYVMYTMLVVTMKSISFLKQIQEVLLLTRCRSLGLNENNAMKAERSRRRHASNNRIWRTFPTHSRVGPKIGGLKCPDKWNHQTIYINRGVLSTTMLCIPQWIISRTTRWCRNNYKQFNNIHYRHSAAVGRFTHGGLFTVYKTVIGD